MVLYAIEPLLLLPGIFGVFGKKGEQAAKDFMIGFLIVMAVLLVGFGVFSLFNILSGT